MRASVRRRQDSVLAKAAAFYTRVADTRPIRPLLSVEGQQYCFTASICYMILALHTLWFSPHLFKYLHLITFTALYIVRFPAYRKLHWQAFCFDFCYVANVLVILANFLPSPARGHLATAAFVCANGPVLWAIVVWRNSLVLHQLDKMISLALHLLPAVANHANTWAPSSLTASAAAAVSGDAVRGLIAYSPWSLASALLAPAGYYLLWQACYGFYFDYIRNDDFRTNPDLESSLRWFTDTDRNNPISLGALQIARNLGVFSKTEEFNFLEWRTKLTFYTFQFTYTLLTFPLAWLAFAHPWLHAFCLGVNFVVACNNAAGYYLSNAYIKQRLAKVAERYAKMQQMHAVHAAHSAPAGGAAAAAAAASDAGAADDTQPGRDNAVVAAQTAGTGAAPTVTGLVVGCNADATGGLTAAMPCGICRSRANSRVNSRGNSPANSRANSRAHSPERADGDCDGLAAHGHSKSQSQPLSPSRHQKHRGGCEHTRAATAAASAAAAAAAAAAATEAKSAGTTGTSAGGDAGAGAGGRRGSASSSASASGEFESDFDDDFSYDHDKHNESGSSLDDSKADGRDAANAPGSCDGLRQRRGNESSSAAAATKAAPATTQPATAAAATEACALESVAASASALAATASPVTPAKAAAAATASGDSDANGNNKSSASCEDKTPVSKLPAVFQEFHKYGISVPNVDYQR